MWFSLVCLLFFLRWFFVFVWLLGFLMVFVWLSLVFLWLRFSYGFPWFSHGFLSFSSACPLLAYGFLCLSDCFLSFSYGFSWFSCGLLGSPRISDGFRFSYCALCFSIGYPVGCGFPFCSHGFLWFSCAFPFVRAPLVSLGFPMFFCIGALCARMILFSFPLIFVWFYDGFRTVFVGFSTVPIACCMNCSFFFV